MLFCHIYTSYSQWQKNGTIKHLILIQTILTSNQKMQRILQRDIRLQKITELKKSEEKFTEREF